MPDLSLRIEGHTDSTGSETWNRQLSELRAASVRDLLEGQGGRCDAHDDRRLRLGSSGRRQRHRGRPRRNRRVEVAIAESQPAESVSGGR
ncbi:MAG TPA: OmpA family protein [Thermoanaerobaculia bacterium]|jgi:outer membrane protein OmpA-like peptidoglycan-associated protein